METLCILDYVTDRNVKWNLLFMKFPSLFLYLLYSYFILQPIRFVRSFVFSKSGANALHRPNGVILRYFMIGSVPFLPGASSHALLIILVVVQVSTVHRMKIICQP